VETTPYSPVGDGESASTNEDSDGKSVDEIPSEGVNDIENALIHAPVSSDHTGLSPDGVLSCQIVRIEVPVERQVSKGQQHAKRRECTFDGCSSHPSAPPLPYPVPIPTPAVRRSSHTWKAPICDNDQCFFVNAYDRTTLEEEIQLRDGGTDNLPRCIEGVDEGGETDACVDMVDCDESHCNTSRQRTTHLQRCCQLSRCQSMAGHHGS